METKYLYNYGYFHKASAHQRNPKRLDKFVEIITCTHPKNVLDVGCGVGRLVARLRDIGIDAYGTDFADSLLGYWQDNKYLQIAEAKNQPFKDKEFDIVVSTDVMEHIPEEDIPAVAAELKRVGKQVLVFVAVEKKLSQRQLLFHVTNKPLEWWIEKMPGIRVFNSRDFE